MKDPTSSRFGYEPRLFVQDALTDGCALTATEAQSHYLLNVMRREPGDAVILFNGRDGEWDGVIEVPKKRQVIFAVTAKRREQDTVPDLWLMFAPLKAAHVEMVVEKATELGVAALMPVITRRTVVHRVNVHRLELIVMEAAEQCERLSLPTIAAPRQLDEVLADWSTTEGRRLFYLDEGAAHDTEAPSIIASMQGTGTAAAILAGPEGGFDPEERQMLRRQSYVTPIVLGPRILRAETASLAAITCWQATQGDWRRTR